MKTSNATNTTWKRRRLGLVALIALAIVAFGGLRSKVSVEQIISRASSEYVPSGPMVYTRTTCMPRSTSSM